MGVEVHGGTARDSNHVRTMVFGLKKKFPSLVRILAGRGYLEALQQLFHLHIQGCLLIFKMNVRTKNFRPQQHR